MKLKAKIGEWQKSLENQTAGKVVEFFLNELGKGMVIASSLGAEDQVLTDMVLNIAPDARIFTIDTGRMPQETYDVIEQTMRKYSMRFEVYFPQTDDVEQLERVHGPNMFYKSIENRKLCCHIRKMKPLKRVLGTADAWATGLRRDQSVTRTGVEKVEWDDANHMVKINPLADWTEEQVWVYIRENEIPYNVLHDQDYPSIGCKPCTRAITPGEDIRAGRWWWEQPEHKECGLHTRHLRVSAVRNT